MKNFILALFLTFISGFTCYPQSFDLSDDFGLLTNGTELFQSGPSDTLQLITWLHLTNYSGNTLQVSMKKEEIYMLPGGSSSICWAGYCYGPEMMVSTFPLTMLPGETVSGCFGHFGPNGCRGVSVIRWTFFDESDPSDSLSVTVHYSTFPSATAIIAGPQYALSPAGPVPADNQIIIRHSLPPGSHGRIELRNLAGKLVSFVGTLSQSGVVSFNTSELPSGIYCCTLMVNGRSVATRQVPVCH